MLFTGKTYDFLKNLAQIYIPAFATFYFAMAAIWNLPAADQVVGSLVAFDTFLGVCLGISQNTYDKSDAKYDGVALVHVPEAGATQVSLELNDDPNELINKQSMTFKVQPSGVGHDL